MNDTKPKIAIIILTYNEEQHIERCIKSVLKIASEIHVIDSGSRDRTVEIAQDLGATVHKRLFKNYADQFQWALDEINIASDWIMRLDSDEVIHDDLSCEILKKLPQLEPIHTGVCFERRHVFMGRWIKHGGRFPLTLLRLWRKGYGRIENRWMDEHIVLSSGTTVTLKGGFSDENLKPLSFFIEKHNKYADREAVDYLILKYKLLPMDQELKGQAGSQASRMRIFKESYYNRLPIFFAPFAYFAYRYFFKLGFLDGVEGLVYHFLQGFWYRFLVSAKIYEIECAIPNFNDRESALARIAELTNLKVGWADARTP